VIGLSTVTTALAPLSFGWVRMRDMAWRGGVNAVKKRIFPEKYNDAAKVAPRPGDRVQG
jgi:hypothetical protein